MSPRLRPATPADLPACAAVTVEAILDLRRRVGREGPPLSAEEELPLLRHGFQLAPQGFHVAEDASGIVAFAAAWPRDGLWWLGHLFARPDAQGNGVGRALLARALAPGASAGSAFTFASVDPRAQSLYLHAGLLPREAIVSALVEDAGDAPESHALAPLRKSSLAFERERFGYARGHDHRFLLESGARGFEVVRADGQRAGFAYVRGADVGPVAVEAPEDVAPALALAAREAGGGPATLRVPASNAAATAWLSERRARFLGSNLLMARAPLPPLDRVALGPPGLA